MSLITEQPWMQEGACTNPDYKSEWWFPHTEDGPGYHDKTIADNKKRAVKICLTECDVRGECETYAVETLQPYGIWGGLTVHQRRPDRYNKPPQPRGVSRPAQRYLDALAADPKGWLTTEQVADQTGKQKTTANRALIRLRERGLVESRVRPGYAGNPVEWRSA